MMDISEVVEVIPSQSQLDRIEEKLDIILGWKDELEAEIKPLLDNLANGGIMGIVGNLFKR